VEGRVVADRKPGRLFIVSTPIGNLGDFSFRAVEVLKAATLVLAEDTRHSRHLLEHYEIDTPLTSYHEHNEARTTPGLVQRLEQGDDIALISDAGTPLLSDPGQRLVDAAIAAGIHVVPIPGASALLAALAVSGMDVERFTYFGFLPRKGQERARILGELQRLSHTAVIYEAPGRLGETLADLAQAGLGARRLAVARELTKHFEDVKRGTVDELAAYYEESPARGEIVIVLAGETEIAPADDELRAHVRRMRAEGISARDIATTLTAELGVKRNVAYRLAHEEL
jgi:16S rRNA (cytidine1402-2'-O)-methyltransferase